MTVVHGRVIDVAHHQIAGARVRGFHSVPTEWSSDPRHPQWDGFLGETRSDPTGQFVLRVSGSASLDYILAQHDARFGVVRSPFSEHIEVTIHPSSERSRRLRHERELERQRKVRTLSLPNHAMQRQ
jgi:hypothetical protein